MRPVSSKRRQQLQDNRPPETSPAVSDPSPPTHPTRATGAPPLDLPPTPSQTYDMGEDYQDSLKLKGLITLVERPNKRDAAIGELVKLIPGASKAQVASFFVPPVGPLKEIQGQNIKGGRKAIISYLIKQHINNELVSAGEDEQKKVEILSRIYRDIDFDPESIKNLWMSSKVASRARLVKNKNKKKMKMKRTKKKTKRTKKKMKRTKKRN